MIVDWGVDLFNGSKDGTTNGHAPLTLGVIGTTSSSSSPPPPDFGPANFPNGPGWNFWEGAWYQNLYGINPGVGVSGALSATGRIDKESPFSMGDTTYFKWWLCIELQDSSLDWDTFIGIAWWQFLLAPTVG